MMFELQPGALPDGYGESVLSLVAAKAHLRVVSSGEDDLVEALRDAAVDMVERMTSLYLARREGIVWKGSGFAPSMVLGRGPAVEVVSVAYDGTGGAEVTLTADDWRLGPHGRLLPAYGKAWPSDCTGEVRVTFDAGYGGAGAEACPPVLVTAVKMMLAQFYDIRGAVITGTISSEVPLGVAHICAMHRMVSI